ncbi:hypothetical protein TNCV_2178491 [Trichonephila clavipes]|uniref:Uncharacterized protein n=1 Tax=Trichonephila clavipes TaxID=2585209 RepID=A0A8X6VU89_TRICX|nr:hypothetical protein TNCV_2178491 [Trichonephila clavipes]
MCYALEEKLAETMGHICSDIIPKRKYEFYELFNSSDSDTDFEKNTHNLLQVPIAELAERWTELPQVSDESRSFFRVHTGYFSNIPKCIKAEFIASWGCSQSSVVSSSQR